jgi:hypothetical protein
MRLRHGQKFVEHLRGCAITCRTDVLPTLCSAAIDAPPAPAIVGLGIPIVVAPSSVPGLTPPMCDAIGAEPSCGFDKKEKNNDRSQDRNT